MALDTVECPKCGRENWGSNFLCISCGERLKDTGTTFRPMQVSKPNLIGQQEPLNVLKGNTVRCPKCNKENSPLSTLCSNCSEPLKGVRVLKSQSQLMVGFKQPPLGIDTVQCSRCGEANRSYALICRRCHTRLKELGPFQGNVQALREELMRRSQNVNRLREQDALYGTVNTPLSIHNQLKIEEEQVKKIEMELASATDSPPLADVLFAQGTHALLLNDLWEAKRCYEQVKKENDLYPRLDEQLRFVSRLLANQARVKKMILVRTRPPLRKRWYFVALLVLLTVIVMGTMTDWISLPILVGSTVLFMLIGWLLIYPWLRQLVEDSKKHRR